MTRLRPLLAPALAGLMWLCGPLGSVAAEASTHLQLDPDHDGRPERLVVKAAGEVTVEQFDPATQQWADAGYQLPDHVRAPGPGVADTGLRFVDLNGDGFTDLLFSSPERVSIHLWNSDVKPHLGWTRGWSQFVRDEPRTNALVPLPSLVGTHVRTEGDQLLVEFPAEPGRAALRLPLRTLIAFDMPPPLSPTEALGAFQLPDELAIELVAAEPVVTDPIAFDWDASGNLWVVEMRDYPLGLDGKGQPGGVVKRLVDRDGDGRCEEAVVFLDALPFPTSVAPWRNGLLIATAPDLIHAEDTDGDGRADRRTVLLTGFVEGNQQHRFNGFEWGLDGWYHVANGDSGGEVRSMATGLTRSISGRDLRFRPDTGEFETVSAMTQYGRRRDDWGNWFGNNNPTWLWQVILPEEYLRRNPQVAARTVIQKLANDPESTRVFPISRAMVRPNQPWSLNHVTSACSPTPYRDDWLGTGFATSVFICEPVHNVLHREVLVPSGPVLASHRAAGEERKEFLASTDVWFRPTTVKTGPDGALYIADMYRFVLEHPEWISREMQARLDLRAGEDRGRLYRVVRRGAARRPIPNLARLEGESLARALDAPNGWQRDTVQRLLLERQAKAAAPTLRQLLAPTHAPQVRLQALATLGLLGVLAGEDLRRGLEDPHPGVRREALRQVESFADRTPLLSQVRARTEDPDPAVRLQAAFSLGAFSPDVAEPLLESLHQRDGEHEVVRIAVLTSLQPDRPLFARLRAATPTPSAVAPPPLNLLPSSPDRAAVVARYRGMETFPADPQKGRALFHELCARCHRLRGEGHDLGPALDMVGSKPVDWLLHAVLDPTAAVEDRYRPWNATLRSGEEVTGMLAAETANNVVLRLPGGIDQPILRTDLGILEKGGGSLMPDGFEQALPPESMAHLLRWLRGP